MYRDYFQTDLEEEPEDSYVEDFYDKRELAESGQFDTRRFDFVETGLNNEIHENFEDIIEDKIFKFKYRQFVDSPQVYARRTQRLVNRFTERAKVRNPALEADLFELYMQDDKDSSFA